jgi:hypothetical protein
MSEALKVGENRYLAWIKSIGPQDAETGFLRAWSELTPAEQANWADIKPWWKSKTLWLNGLVLMLAAAESQLNVLQGALPGGLFTWLAFGLPVANAALRFITSTALGKS